MEYRQAAVRSRPKICRPGRRRRILGGGVHLKIVAVFGRVRRRTNVVPAVAEMDFRALRGIVALGSAREMDRPVGAEAQWAFPSVGPGLRFGM